MRYLAVAELHKNGFPHWHALVHEEEGTTAANLQSHWTAGFSNVKLVREPRAILYITKYLHKEAMGRVRCSLNYGQPHVIDPGQVVDIAVYQQKLREYLGWATQLPIENVQALKELIKDPYPDPLLISNQSKAD